MSEEKKKKSVKKSDKDGDAKKTKKHTSDSKTKRTSICRLVVVGLMKLRLIKLMICISN
jgi:hypothetical protein